MRLILSSRVEIALPDAVAREQLLSNFLHDCGKDGPLYDFAAADLDKPGSGRGTIKILNTENPPCPMTDDTHRRWAGKSINIQ
jgi:hypothetical protein